MKRLAALGVLSLWLASMASWPGCAAVIDASSELGDACRFDGDEDTSCGQCVAYACRAEVDACCSDEECAPALSFLDGCADGDEDDCEELYDADGAGEALGNCVESACPVSCEVGDPVTWCNGDETSCRCDYDLTDVLADDTTCNIATVKGGLCCADLGWPDVGLGCTCENLSCRETGDGCECDSLTEGPMTSCTGTFCCADTYSCTCGETPCDETMFRVEMCSIAIYTCTEDEVVIDACSAVD